MFLCSSSQHLPHYLIVVKYFHTEINKKTNKPNNICSNSPKRQTMFTNKEIFIVYMFLLLPLHFVDQIWLTLLCTPFTVHDEMYSMKCDVIFSNLLLYINTFDLLILWKNYLLNHPCCLINKRKCFFCEKEANVSVNYMSLCYWYTFVHAHVKGKISISIKSILLFLLLDSSY